MLRKYMYIVGHFILLVFRVIFEPIPLIPFICTCYTIAVIFMLSILGYYIYIYIYIYMGRVVQSV